MTNLNYRFLTIGALILASLYALMPRQVIERVNRDGQFVYDTVQRVPLKLGLDLQGGMHITLEIDESKGVIQNPAEALDRAVKVVRTRIDEFGVAEPIVQKVGDDRIEVELPGIDDPARAQAVVQKNAFLQFQITDKTQSLEKVAGRLDNIVKAQGITAGASGATDTAAAKSKSLFASGDTAAKADSAGADTATVAPGAGPFSTKIQPGQLPGQYVVAEDDYPLFDRALNNAAVQAALPPGKVIRWGLDSIGIGFRTLYVLEAREILTGEALTDARPVQDAMEGTVVSFQLNAEGGRRFRSETQRHIGDYMAVVLDEKVMTAPIIQGAIGSRGQITLGRGRDITEAQDLALILRAGALPVPLKVADVRTIGPSLGEDSIRSGMQALGVSVILVILIMVVYYRFSGVLAVAGLTLYMLFTLAILAGFNATLTLPGLAGFVLSVGIAVDANILIFERIREELDGGKTIRLAIDEGFRHAMSAIVDSSVSTALTAAVLYQYGTGPVRGFAVTLLAGIIASLFCAIFVVKTFYLFWMSRKADTQTLSI
jgi:preprotein translocase subunit SecD